MIGRRRGRGRVRWVGESGHGCGCPWCGRGSSCSGRVAGAFFGELKDVIKGYKRLNHRLNGLKNRMLISYDSYLIGRWEAIGAGS